MCRTVTHDDVSGYKLPQAFQAADETNAGHSRWIHCDSACSNERHHILSYWFVERSWGHSQNLSVFIAFNTTTDNINNDCKNMDGRTDRWIDRRTQRFWSKIVLPVSAKTNATGSGTIASQQGKRWSAGYCRSRIVRDAPRSGKDAIQVIIEGFKKISMTLFFWSARVHIHS